MGFWKCKDGTEVEMIFNEQGQFVKFGDDVKEEDVEKAKNEINAEQKELSMCSQEQVNDIEQMIDAWVHVYEIAEKYSGEFCVTDCGMKMPPTCHEDADCNDCWVKCLENKLNEDDEDELEVRLQNIRNEMMD